VKKNSNKQDIREQQMPFEVEVGGNRLSILIVVVVFLEERFSG